MQRFNAFIVAYSLLLLIGGVTGYFVAGSFASLLMSAIFAILLIGALFLVPFKPQFAYRAIYGLLTLLVLFFGYRWYVGKFFPAGLLCILSITVLAFTFSRSKIFT